MKEEDVGGVGGAPSDVHGLGESEILGKADKLHFGELAVPLSAAVGRSVIDDDRLQAAAAFRSFERFQASAQECGAIVGDHHRRNARRGRFLIGMFCGGQEDRITLWIAQSPETPFALLTVFLCPFAALRERFFSFPAKAQRRKEEEKPTSFLLHVRASVRNSVPSRLTRAPGKRYHS